MKKPPGFFPDGFFITLVYIIHAYPGLLLMQPVPAGHPSVHIVSCEAHHENDFPIAMEKPTKISPQH